MQWNRYVFVGNDPVNNADPNGMASCEPVKKTRKVSGWDPADRPGLRLDNERA